MGLTEKRGQSGDGAVEGVGNVFRVLGIVAVLAMSLLTFGVGTRNAVAYTFWSDVAGYMGNNAIYMTTSVLGTATDSFGFGAYILPEFAPVSNMVSSGNGTTRTRRS